MKNMTDPGMNVVGTPRTETGLAREVTPEYDPQFQLEGHGHVSPPTQSCPGSGWQCRVVNPPPAT